MGYFQAELNANSKSSRNNTIRILNSQTKSRLNKDLKNPETSQSLQEICSFLSIRTLTIQLPIDVISRRNPNIVRKKKTVKKNEVITVGMSIKQ